MTSARRCHRPGSRASVMFGDVDAQARVLHRARERGEIEAQEDLPHRRRVGDEPRVRAVVRASASCSPRTRRRSAPTVAVTTSDPASLAPCVTNAAVATTSAAPQCDHAPSSAAFRASLHGHRLDPRTTDYRPLGITCGLSTIFARCVGVRLVQTPTNRRDRTDGSRYPGSQWPMIVTATASAMTDRVLGRLRRTRRADRTRRRRARRRPLRTIIEPSVVMNASSPSPSPGASGRRPRRVASVSEVALRRGSVGEPADRQRDRAVGKDVAARVHVSGRRDRLGHVLGRDAETRPDLAVRTAGCRDWPAAGRSSGSRVAGWTRVVSSSSTSRTPASADHDGARSTIAMVARLPSWRVNLPGPRRPTRTSRSVVPDRGHGRRSVAAHRHGSCPAPRCRCPARCRCGPRPRSGRTTGPAARGRCRRSRTSCRAAGAGCPPQSQYEFWPDHTGTPGSPSTSSAPASP